VLQALGLPQAVSRARVFGRGSYLVYFTLVMVGLLSLCRVSLGFRRSERHVVQVLRGVSLDVGVGEVVSVLARRAQGKTTLLRVAAGMWRPGAGKVYFEGRDLWELSDRERSGLLARRIALVRPLKPGVDIPTLEHVEVPLRMVCGRREARRGALAALERVGAGDCAQQRWGSLADWERALVALAQGIARKPSLLLVDDLTATLGLVETDELTRLVGTLCGEMGMGVLMSVSDANATAWSQRTATLSRGELLQPPPPPQGEPDNVIEFPSEERSHGA
jgi:predicted ABC-type transport system involved in lysophospholipase L1 biosynthesis ATPase subunit